MIEGMDAFTRKLALRNAAKVALGSLFFGCGGALTVDGPLDAAAPLPDAPSDAPLADAAVPDATALACTGPTQVDASDVAEDAFQCCIATVQADVGDASLWSSDGADASAVTDDPSASNCCRVIVARLDHEPDGGDWSADFSSAEGSPSLLPWYCAANGYPSDAACTPWGPPTPPDMEVA